MAPVAFFYLNELEGPSLVRHTCDGTRNNREVINGRGTWRKCE